MKKKAVVTGGAGFIGSHLVDTLLKKNIMVEVIDNLSTGRIENLSHVKKEIRFHNLDLSLKNNLLSEIVNDADYIFHLASLADIVPSIKHPEVYFKANVEGTLNLLNSINIDRIKKFVYAASSSCYGLAKVIPTPETADIIPEYPYALTKFLGEELVMHWSKVYKLRAISTRFFNVYGTRSRTSGTYGAVFGVFLAQKLSNKPLTIVGNGSQKRDFTYVTDVCEGLYLAATSKFVSDIFNIGSGNPQSVNYLARLIGGDTINIPKRPGEPEITHADIEKAKSLLGFNSKVSFEEGVKKVLANIDYWKNAPVWTPDSISKETKEWFEYLS